MEYSDSTRNRFISRRIGVVFSVLAAVPLSLAVLEVLLSGRLPESVITVLELPYLLLVYLPIAIIGAFVFEPLGIPELLGSTPLAGELTVLITLLGFYYFLTVVLVNLSSFARKAAIN